MPLHWVLNRASIALPKGIDTLVALTLRSF
jgi:hypothetical protein